MSTEWASATASTRSSQTSSGRPEPRRVSFKSRKSSVRTLATSVSPVVVGSGVRDTEVGAWLPTKTGKLATTLSPREPRAKTST